MHVRRFWVSGIVLAATIALLPFSFHAERHLETATRVEGSQAETVRQELANRFRSPFVDQVVLVIQGLPPASSDGRRTSVRNHREGTERPTRRFGSGVLSRLARSDLSGPGRGNVCDRRTDVDRRSGGVAGSASFTSWQARLKINCGAVIRRLSSNSPARFH